MNYDDKFTRDFEEKFQKSLKKIRNFSKEDRQKVEENIMLLSNIIEEIVDKPDKSPDEIELLAKLQLELPKLIQILEDQQLILDESLYRKSRAQYEHLKKLAKEGNKEAEKLYLELKPYVEKFDVN